jgi:hypothetical protein
VTGPCPVGIGEAFAVPDIAARATARTKSREASGGQLRLAQQRRVIAIRLSDTRPYRCPLGRGAGLADPARGSTHTARRTCAGIAVRVTHAIADGLAVGADGDRRERSLALGGRRIAAVATRNRRPGRSARETRCAAHRVVRALARCSLGGGAKHVPTRVAGDDTVSAEPGDGVDAARRGQLADLRDAGSCRRVVVDSAARGCGVRSVARGALPGVGKAILQRDRREAVHRAAGREARAGGVRIREIRPRRGAVRAAAASAASAAVSAVSAASAVASGGCRRDDACNEDDERSSRSGHAQR